MEYKKLNKLSQYLTIEQAAYVLQVSYDYVNSLVSKGILASIRLPGELDSPIQISAESFTIFIAGCTVTKDLPPQEISKPKPQEVYTGVFAV